MLKPLTLIAFLVAGAMLSGEARSQAASLTVTDVTRRVVIFDSYCGSVRADLGTFRSTTGQHPNRPLPPNRAGSALSAYSFAPSPGIWLDLYDFGNGRLRCGTYDVGLDAAPYVQAFTANRFTEPETGQSGTGEVQSWVWPINPSTVQGRLGWRWLILKRTLVRDTAIISMSYYSFRPSPTETF